MNDPSLLSNIVWETAVCSLCGGEKTEFVTSAQDLLYRCAGRFELVRCADCRHVFLNPRPSRESIGRFYPADYGPFRGGSPKGSSPDRISQPAGRETERSRFDIRSWHWLRRIVLWWIDSRAAPIPKFNDSSRRRVLELGCSHGQFLEQLESHGGKVIGVEPATDVAQQARDRGFEVHVGSLEKVVNASPQTFVPQSFDAIFAWMVVEHLHDPVATLRLARELLRPDGWLSFSVPNFGCWERRAFGQFWYALQLPTHLQHFTPTSVRCLLDAAGFELIEMIHQRNVNNLVGSVGLWLRTKFPNWSLGERLIHWTDSPSALGLILLSPLARLLAMLRQGGRLTVVAKRDRRPRGELADADAGIVDSLAGSEMPPSPTTN